MNRLLAAAALATFPAVIGAQTIRGVVVDQGDIPVPGVVVQLLDSTSRSVSRTLSNERGEFRVAASAPGTYRVTTLRIGYRPLTSPPVSLGRGEDVTKRLVLSGVRVVLDAARIVERTSCRSFADSAAATYAVWEQIRAALTATQLTAASSSIAATMVVYERTLYADGRRIRKQNSSIYSEYVRQPWLAQSPDVLRQVGYVSTDAAGITTYNAPGLDMLLSDGFVQDHCFHLTADNGRVGLVFEPIPERRKISEIRGTLWIDQPSSELRSAEFRFVNISREEESEARGDMGFARMKNGAWAISAWNIRMPVFELPKGPQATGGSQLRLAEVHVAGGELAVARRGDDTLWSRPPLVLVGTVIDSATGSAIERARVSIVGTQLAGATDARGRFSIRDVLPGEYSVEVRTPSLDSVSAVHQSSIAFTGTSEPLEVRVPSARQIISLACGSTPLDLPGIVLGTVAVRGDTLPPPRTTVVVEWSESSLQGTANSVGVARQKKWTDARTDSHGTFRVCGVPRSTLLSVHAENSSGNSAPVEVQVPRDGRFARAELTLDARVARGAVLTGVVMMDSTQQPIVAAEVTLPQLGKTVLTNERGAFRIADIPAGDQPLVVRHLGYGALNATVTFAANQTVDRRIFLSRAVTLDSVKVSATASDLVLRSFDEHRKLGLGHFLTRADLEKLPNVRISSVLEQLPGVNMVYGNKGQGWPTSNRGPQCAPPLLSPACYTGGGVPVKCYAQVYMDQMLMNPERPAEPFDVNRISSDQVESIEFFSGPSQTPPEYTRTNSPCGVLVIHTRRP